MPGLYVTANLYLPKNLQSPAPAILYLCGHGPVIKDGVSYGNKVSYQHHGAWFAQHGYRIDELPVDVIHEGAGDALPFGGVLVSGYRWRSDARSHAALSRLTAAPVRTVELIDDRLYHLDITFCPLDERRAMACPAAWDRYGATVVGDLVPELLVLELDEALAFTANSIVIGATVVMPHCPARVGRQLETWGFDVVVADVSEFLKAGGGVRCLTLALDVTLGGTT